MNRIKYTIRYTNCVEMGKEIKLDQVPKVLIGNLVSERQRFR